MGYFKERRRLKEKSRRSEMMSVIMDQAKVTNILIQKGVGDAIDIFDAKKYEYEKNARSNLKVAIEDERVLEKFIEEIAKVIEEGMQLYTFRIAKGKREELAIDILTAISQEEK